MTTRFVTQQSKFFLRSLNTISTKFKNIKTKLDMEENKDNLPVKTLSK